LTRPQGEERAEAWPRELLLFYRCHPWIPEVPIGGLPGRDGCSGSTAGEPRSVNAAERWPGNQLSLSRGALSRRGMDLRGSLASNELRRKVIL
jgi:hypothetical protein